MLFTVIYLPLLAQKGAINLKPRDRTYVSNVTPVLVPVSQTLMLYLLESLNQVCMSEN